MFSRSDRIDRHPRAGWLLVVVLLAAGIAVSWTWAVPDASGIPFRWAWLALSALGVAGGELLVHGGTRTAMRRPGRSGGWIALRPVEAVAIVAVAAMLLTDITLLPTRPLRDLGIYLHAGDHFLHGAPVYITSLFTQHPSDPTTYPYLYPPLTLPFAAFMAALPYPLVAAAWVCGSIAAVLASLRAFGVPWPLAVLLLLWPPIAQGLYVGNVAMPALALFALGPRFGEGLVLGAVVKLYTGLLAVWLLLERRVRSLVLGVVLLALLTLVTLPLTGVSAWADWLHALDLYRQSEPLLPAYLYGSSLARFLPFALYLIVGLAVLAFAIIAQGPERLARLGIATIALSPSLFGHGFALAVPAIFALGEPWAWLALGLMSAGAEAGLWVGVGIVVAAWVLPPLTEGGRTPWPSAREPRRPMARWVS